MKTKSKRTKSKPVGLSLYPVTLFTEDGTPVECLQYCRDDEEPLSGERNAQDYFDDIEEAMNHYAGACALSKHLYPSHSGPLLLISATVE